MKEEKRKKKPEASKLPALSSFLRCGFIMDQKFDKGLLLVCFAVFFIPNILFVRVLDISTIMAVILISLVESLLPYLIIVLIIHVINHENRPS